MNTKTIWEKEFGEYDRGTQRLAPIILQIRRRPHVKTVLDIGCNTGLLAEALPDIRYSGLDFILGAEAERRNIKFYDVNSGLDFPVEGKFDCIVMSGILEYAENPFDLLAKARARLADSGCLLVSYVNFFYLPVLMRKLFNLETRFHETWKNTLDYNMLRRNFSMLGMVVRCEITVDFVLSTRMKSCGIFPRSFPERNLGDVLSKQKLFVCEPIPASP